MAVKVIVVNGQDTVIHAGPLAIFSPVNNYLIVKSALLVEGPTEVFEKWQDVTYYFFVDEKRSALYQRPGANLAGAKIMIFLEP